MYDKSSRSINTSWSVTVESKILSRTAQKTRIVVDPGRLVANVESRLPNAVIVQVTKGQTSPLLVFKFCFYC